MSDNTNKVKRYFDRTATSFDALYAINNQLYHALNSRFRAGLFQRVQITLDACGDLEEYSVLDVGCGSGRNAIPFALAGAKRVVGIDFAPNMISLARHAADQAGVGDRCEFLVGDFLKATLLEPFDVVVALGVFDYIADPVPFLRRMRELSRSKVIISAPGYSLWRTPLRLVRYRLAGCPVHFYTRQGLQRIFQGSGFTRYEIVPCRSSGFVVIGTVPKSDS